jgi:hypothetical protein
MFFFNMIFYNILQRKKNFNFVKREYIYLFQLRKIVCYHKPHYFDVHTVVLSVTIAMDLESTIL